MGDETKIQMREVKKGVEAMGSVIERYLIRFLGPLGRKISQSSKSGRFLALIGVVAVAIVLGIFIFSDALRVWTRMHRSHSYIIMQMRQDYGIILLAGVVLMIIGIMQKKK